MKPIKEYVLEYNEGLGAWNLYIDPSDSRVDQIKLLACVSYIDHHIADHYTVFISPRYSSDDFERAITEIFSKGEGK
jgi:hypothetical protein